MEEARDRGWAGVFPALSRFCEGAGIALALLAAVRASRPLFGPSLADAILPVLAFLAGLSLGALILSPRSGRRARFLGLIACTALIGLVPGFSRLQPPGSLAPPALFALLAFAGGLALGSRTAVPGSASASPPGWGSAAALLGACVGALAGTHVLIPAFGDRGASIGAVLGLAVSVVAGSRTPDSPGRAGAPGAGSGRPWNLLFSIGLFALALALAWIGWGRTLDLLIGPTLRSTGLLSAMVLLGLALGTFLGRVSPGGRASRVPAVLFAGVLVALQLVLVAVSADLPYLFVKLVRGDAGDPGLVFRARVILVALAILPCAVAAGALLRRLLDALARENREGVPVFPSAFAALAGGLAIGLAAGPALLPSAGIRGLLLASAGLSAAIGAFSLIAARSTRLAVRVPLAICLLLLLVVTVVNPPRWRPGLLNTGPYVYAGLYTQIDAEGFNKTYSLLPSYYKEGKRETILVAGASGNRLLLSNGAVEMSDRAHRPLQVLLARLPLLFRPGARTAYLVGAGAGITAGTLLGGGVDTVLCVEPEEGRLEAMRHFASANHEPWNDARARFVVGDPRRALAREDGRFDLIVCMSVYPWDRNAAHLNTEEFFHLTASRLRPEGLVAASFPLAGGREEHLGATLAGFRSAFPYVLAFETPGEEALVALGSGRPLVLRALDLLRVWGDLTTETDFRESDMKSVHDLVVRALLDGATIDSSLGASPPNRDGSALVEMGSDPPAPASPTGRLPGLIRSLHFDADRLLDYEGLSREERGSFRFETARAFLRARYAPGGLLHAARAHEDDPTGPAASLYGHLLKREAGDLDSAIAIVRGAWERDRNDPSLVHQLGDYTFSARRFEECDRLLTEAIDGGLTDAWCYVVRGKARLGLKRNELALEDLLLGKELDRLQDNSGDINYFIGMAYKNLGKIEESQGFLARAVERSPRHIYARYEYGENRLLRGEIDQAAFDSAYAVPFNRARAETLFDRAEDRLFEPQHAEEVERDLLAVVNTTPRHYGAYLALAEFYFRHDKPEKEREALGQMVARLGDSPVILRHIREYLRATGGEARVRAHRDLLP